MHTQYRFIAFLLLAVASPFALGQMAESSVQSVSLTGEIISQAINSITPLLTELSFNLLRVCLVLQIIFGCLRLLPGNADMDAALSVVLKTLIWGGLIMWAINDGPGIIRNVGLFFFEKFDQFFPSLPAILTSTLGVSAGLVVASLVVGQLNTTAGIAGLGITLLVLAAGVGLALKILLLHVELMLNVAMAPMSFSLAGLSALRDQGLAPFKSLISLMYRVVIYAVLCAAFMKVSEATVDVLKNLSAKDLLAGMTTGFDIFKLLLASAMAHAILLLLLFRSDQIASNLASGSTSLNTGDLAAAAMTASVAGSMVGGVASQAIQGTKAQGLGEMMKSLLGSEKVGMRNASAQGELPGMLRPDSMGGSMSIASEQAGSGGGSGARGEGGSTNPPSPNPDKFRGVPNPLPEPKRDAERDAAREARRQARRQAQTGQQDAGAGIGGASQPAIPGRGLGNSFDRLSHELERGKAATHVSMTASSD